MINNIKKITIIGYLALFLMFYLLFFANLFFIFHFSVNVLIFYLSLISTALTSYLLFKEKYSLLELIIFNILHLILIICLLYVYRNIYGFDYDGNAYHKLAVGLLKNCWNPLYGDSIDYFGELFGYVSANIQGVKSEALWVDHYGKSSWIIASIIYKLTDRVNCGMIYHLLAIISCFFISLDFLIDIKCNIISSFVLSIFTALNPISLIQISSYYVDGFLFSLFFILIFGLLRFIISNNNKNEILSFAIVFTAMPILANIKFTGLFFGGLFCFIYFIFFTFNNIKNTKKILIIFCFFTFVALISILFFGSHTYLKNFIDHGSPIYPLFGNDSVDIITRQMPRGFLNKSPIFKFFYSMFSEMCFISDTDARALPDLKFPFTILFREIYALNVDNKCSGFGMFNSGIFIIAITSIIFYLVANKKKINLSYIILSINVFLCVLLIVFFDESWWARYSPHVYLFEIIGLYCLTQILESYLTSKMIKRVLLSLLFLILFINNFHMLAKQRHIIIYSSYIKRNFDMLFKKNILAKIGPNPYYGNIFDMMDANINFKIKKEIEKPNGNFYEITYQYFK